MNTSHLVPRTLYFIPLFLFCFLKINAQRLEVHAIKDFSTNTIANKAWGVGGAIDFDQWVKKTTFRINFDWAIYKKIDNTTNPNYQRLSGGISAFYSFKLTEKITFQCGAGLNYSNLKHSFIYDIDSLQHGKPLTVQHTGNFIGIGPHLELCYELAPRFNVVLNFVPNYLIPVSRKSNVKTIDPEYEKGVWLFPIQLGISFKLFNPDQ